MEISRGFRVVDNERELLEMIEKGPGIGGQVISGTVTVKN